MPSAIVTTPGSDTANSYASLAEARVYYSNTPGADADDLFDDEKLTQGLLTATGLIDDLVDFDGWPTHPTQALSWPRTGLYQKGEQAGSLTAQAWFTGSGISALLDTTTIPAAVKNATAELARQLLANTTLASNAGALAGLTRLKAGRAIELEFAPGTQVAATVIPDNVARMLARWGRRRGKTGTLKLVRS